MRRKSLVYTSAGVVAVVFTLPFTADLGTDKQEPVMVARITPATPRSAILDLEIALRKGDRLSHEFAGEYLPAEVWSEGRTTYAIQRMGE